MKQYEKIYVPDEKGNFKIQEFYEDYHEWNDVHGRDDILSEKENVIVLSLEELREMFKQARRKTERGDAPYIYPTVEEYLTSKGINITENG